MTQELDKPKAAVLEALTSNLGRVFSMLEKAIETCPSDLWATKQGGFYYWQQLFHVFATIDIFIKTPSDPPTQTMFDVDVVRLVRHEEHAPSPSALLAVAKVMRTELDTFLTTLTWEKLYARNELRSQRMGFEVNCLDSMVMLVGHAFYHLGVCDCTLRNNGLKGFI